MLLLQSKQVFGTNSRTVSRHERVALVVLSPASFRVHTNTYSSPPTVLSTASSNTIEADIADQQTTALSLSLYQLLSVFSYSGNSNSEKGDDSLFMCVSVCATVLI